MTTVKETKDYEKFSFLGDNRELNKGHINKLVNSMLEYGYIKTNPIIVNADYQIVDGQHRFEACRKLGIPVVYIVDDSDLLRDNTMAVLNTVARTWTLDDFCNHFARRGNPTYMQLQQFASEQKLAMGKALQLVTGNTTRNGRRGTSDFKEGKLSLATKDFVRARELLDTIRSLCSMGNIPFTSRPISAIIKMAKNDNFNLEKMVAKMSRNRDKAYIASSVDGFVAMFQSIYNLKERTKVDFLND